MCLKVAFLNQQTILPRYPVDSGFAHHWSARVIPMVATKAAPSLH
jgi:hypothetical protein